MNKLKKLTIRINFRAEKDRAPENKKRYHYHWGRITGISLAAVVTIASLLSAGSYYLNQEKIDSEYVKSVTDKNIAYQDQSSLKKEAVLAALQKESQLTATALPAVENSLPKTAKIESKKTPSGPSNESLIQAVEISPSAVRTVKPAATETKTIPAEITLIKPAVSEKKSISERLFTQSLKKSFSDNVIRFVISQAVEGNEPIGTIDKVHFDSNNIATVYAYSDVNGLKDQTLYYQWSLNGKNIAKIKVEVGANRWRSYSSKFIQPDMHGEWKVELQNHTGENLAINQFSY
ncbi:hypothetical protein Ping_0839 [Psychromonas ingrahamii 37]|uniref:DUF2914 domain-containing protein n=1 Tax=Psychromonas ingrahamii (strain DSM 17664 / CCUG 51855 / 37) TaxID=357804 RepID=A1ST67_PSYIN|nr:DUF2914 domain-containing protein [Psychromonas ingrahamii]ABM02682.1 hypothetical protein Ping_0839 [Psychromonas ingrahamii 37]